MVTDMHTAFKWTLFAVWSLLPLLVSYGQLTKSVDHLIDELLAIHLFCSGRAPKAARVSTTLNWRITSLTTLSQDVVVWLMSDPWLREHWNQTVSYIGAS